MIISLDELCFCTNLEELDCSNNNLTKLDITHNKNIKTIICHYNKLNKINISNNIKLDMLECSNNNLTHIDNLETCINLRELYASDNKIISMKTPPKIIRIVCSNNELTNFEVRSKELKYLNCNKNQINDLYLASEKLEELCCRFNKLKYIDVSRFSNLTQFDCDNNPLDELPNITNLAKLMCFFHPPSVFHISLSQEDMENMRCDYMANNNYIYKVKKYQITFFNKN
jgi:Leucine-rich repeat (LRR) protein